MPIDRRHRRTATALERDILTAVLQALLVNGYRGVTFEDVARRAQVSKPVLYRRFADRPAMVLAALAVRLQQQLTDEVDRVPGDGNQNQSLRGDLIAWFTHAQQRANSIGIDTYRGLVGEADPASLAAIIGLGENAAALIRAHVIDPAVARGELGLTPLPDRILFVPLQVLRDGALFSDTPPDIAEIVDAVALPLYRNATQAT